jgi:hypothetical protein
VTAAEPQSVVPVDLVAATLYRVVAVGCTVIDPLSGTGVPFNVALTDADQVISKTAETNTINLIVGITRSRDV